jgi:hypothetical protein
MIDTEYNNYMRAKLRNGQHFTDDYTGYGMPSVGYGTGPNTNYVFSGDPGDTTQWTECNSNNNPGDRRTVLSSNDFPLNAGSSQKVVFALLVADTAKGCPVTSFNDIRIVADTAWGNYFQNASGVKNITPTNSLNIYPNPAHNQLFIENTNANPADATITFYNIIGQQLNINITKTGNKWTADVSNLPTGLYLVYYSNGAIQKTVKFLKE